MHVFALKWHLVKKHGKIPNVMIIIEAAQRIIDVSIVRSMYVNFGFALA